MKKRFRIMCRIKNIFLFSAVDMRMIVEEHRARKKKERNYKVEVHRVDIARNRSQFNFKSFKEKVRLSVQFVFSLNFPDNVLLIYFNYLRLFSSSLLFLSQYFSRWEWPKCEKKNVLREWIATTSASAY